MLLVQTINVSQAHRSKNLGSHRWVLPCCRGPTELLLHSKYCWSKHENFYQNIFQINGFNLQVVWIMVYNLAEISHTQTPLPPPLLARPLPPQFPSPLTLTPTAARPHDGGINFLFSRGREGGGAAALALHSWRCWSRHHTKQNFPPGQIQSTHVFILSLFFFFLFFGGGHRVS